MNKYQKVIHRIAKNVFDRYSNVKYHQWKSNVKSMSIHTNMTINELCVWGKNLKEKFDKEDLEERHNNYIQ